MDAVLTGPNKSIWNSSKGLEVDTMSFDLKEVLTIFLSDMHHRVHLNDSQCLVSL